MEVISPRAGYHCYLAKSGIPQDGIRLRLRYYEIGLVEPERHTELAVRGVRPIEGSWHGPTSHEEGSTAGAHEEIA